ncbi:MAG: tetratricopeptide repeat protein [Ornithinimicrobium sp.]
MDDLDGALAHALTASRRAGRVPIVREMAGVVFYRRQDWAKALSEFRTARRLSGSHHLLPLIADTERGLGRPERAIEIARGPEVATLKRAERVELAIVVAGARQDLGDSEVAVHSLQDVVDQTRDEDDWAARLYYAYADALARNGSSEQAGVWLSRAARLDPSGETDARERLNPSGADSEQDGIETVSDLDQEV